MKLRIISGSLKGRTITGPDRDLSFRPTLERTRQSVADMISPLCGGAIAADLCAGSGSFGFEMISRGAQRVDFVETDRGRADLMIAHAEKFGVAERCRIIKKDVVVFLQSCRDRYDIIFFDPPYDSVHLKQLVPAMMKLLIPGGIILYQRRRPSGTKGERCQENGPPFEIKTFGDTVVEIYKQANKE
jgi:16S rRNA (guanine966-N2)-methyltransferase